MVIKLFEPRIAGNSEALPLDASPSETYTVSDPVVFSFIIVDAVIYSKAPDDEQD